MQAGTSALTAPFGRDVIESIIPHRDPFLFLDEVTELEPGRRVVARRLVRPDEWFFPGHFPERPIMPGVIIVEALAQAGAVAVLSLEENRGKLALFGGIDGVRFKRIVEPGDELTLTCEVEAVRGPIGKGRVEARVAGELAVRGTLDLRGAMIGTANGYHVSITGIGSNAPEYVRTNDELSRMVDTSDEWIVARTGIRERRVAREDEALTDMALPAARDALAQAGVDPADLDLIIVATVTPDMTFPATAALMADELGAPDAAAYDLSAGCTGFMYGIAQAYGMLAGGICRRALVVGGDVLSKIVDWSDRTTCIVFGDGAGAVVMERVESGGFLGFELGADGAGGMQLYLPAGGSRTPTSAATVARARRTSCT